MRQLAVSLPNKNSCTRASKLQCSVEKIRDRVVVRQRTNCCLERLSTFSTYNLTVGRSAFDRLNITIGSRNRMMSSKKFQYLSRRLTVSVFNNSFSMPTREPIIDKRSFIFLPFHFPRSLKDKYFYSFLFPPLIIIVI